MTQQEKLDRLDEIGFDPDNLNLKPNDFSDVGQAYILAREYGDRLRYSKATDYLYYTGSVWQENGLKAHSIAQNLTDRQLNEAIGTYFNEADEKYYKYVIARRKSSVIAASLKEAEPTIASKAFGITVSLNLYSPR